MALHPRADVDSEESLLRGSFKAARLLSKGRAAGHSGGPSAPHAQLGVRRGRPRGKQQSEGASMDPIDYEDLRLDAEETVAAAQDRGYEQARRTVVADARAKDPAARSAWERFELRSEETRDEPSRFGAGPEAQERRLACLAQHGVSFPVREVTTFDGGSVEVALRRARRDLDRRLSASTRCRVRVSAPRRPSCQGRRGRRRRGVTRRRATRAGPGGDAGAGAGDDDPGSRPARAAR
jgi:hypothetical protein